MDTLGDFIKRNKEYNKNSDEKIIEFIYNFLSHSDSDSTHYLFRSGYCYYFAQILKNAFNDGDVCLAYPFGHFVYVVNDVPYDIEGVYSGESNEFIPEEYLGEMIYDFKRVPGKSFNATEEQIKEIYNKYLRDL